jgi:hypothetical protein
MTILEVILIITNIATLVTAGFLTRRALIKTEFYEQWILVLKTRLQRVYEAIRLADIRGSFEADDEVGVVYKNIKANIDDLEKFTEGE